VIAPKAASQRPSRHSRRLARLVSGVDLLIDLATLGEYGLARPLPAEGPRSDASGHAPGWEALAIVGPRRGGCGPRDRLAQRT
jgi:hypothetical protein